MQFVLNYRGPLPSNGSIREKHRLRSHFHDQLTALWNQAPLNHHLAYIRRGLAQPASESENRLSVVEQVGQHFFAPLVTDRLHLASSLNITLLRPEEPGGIISGGDIDNRLKTLFDALSMPPHTNQVPNDVPPNTDSAPVLCLLKDDNLITSVNVRCDRLLDASIAQEVLLLIEVSIRATCLTYANIGISG